MMTLPWHELVSWCIALVSATLFFVERRKNDNTKYYMVLQGILRACHQRAGFLAHTRGKAQESGRDVPCEEFDFVLNSEYANYLQLQEHIMGSMQSLQPGKDMPFDVGGFIQSGLSEGKSENLPETGPASTGKQGRYEPPGALTTSSRRSREQDRAPRPKDA